MQARLREIRDGVKEKGAAFFSATVERLDKQPSPERPPAPLEGTYDGMLLSLLRRTAEDVNNLGVASGDSKLDEELIKSLDAHLKRMPEFLEKAKKELEHEEAEQKKKITSDDIRPGFSSTVCNAVHEMSGGRLIKHSCCDYSIFLPNRSQNPSPVH